ncbi:vitamin K-dependent gamma-carboxylase-like isoform X1 [Apostichopus japonicus]|uniref:vitamin K-dependent gamma-carboxylase-like isoform X1 n=2 Tax=Stichopus japonicus TaxID=307972 RepID=UPI003AB64511
MAPNTSRGSASNKRKSEKYKQTQEVKQETANISPKMKKIFGFTVEDITSWSRFKPLMNQPRDPAGLGIWRILFGFLMVLDVFQERGLPFADDKFSDPNLCFFPLFNFITPLPVDWMYLVYLILLIGAIGMCIGLFYRVSCLLYLIPYWYIFLLDKTTWNNHSYLFGLTAFLMTFVDANRFWSVDAIWNKNICNVHVPVWHYAILRLQIFLVYFIAGLKKLDLDWVQGFSMEELSINWVFDPFRLIGLSNTHIDYFIVHLGGLCLDLSAGFFLFFDFTRPVAAFFVSSFHVMNSQLFYIGLFPYVMLTTSLIFFYPDWPKKLFQKLPASLSTRLPSLTTPAQSLHCVYQRPHEIRNPPKSTGLKTEKRPNHSSSSSSSLSKFTKYHSFGALFFIFYTSIQLFLPYSHFITQGFNNWTNGLYGYSWDMMVHTWNVQHTKLRFLDKASDKEGYLSPDYWTETNRWKTHADMVKQYTTCVANKLHQLGVEEPTLYLDIWLSMNGRFQQRIWNPDTEMITAEWSPFKPTPWLMPLLTDLSDWRTKLAEIEEQLDSHIDVTFVADFPGLFLENFVDPHLGNTSLHVLSGNILVEIPAQKKNVSMAMGDTIKLSAGEFHNVHTVSSTPSCYMYLFVNTTRALINQRVAEFMEQHNLTFEDPDLTASLAELHVNTSDPEVVQILETIFLKLHNVNILNTSSLDKIQLFLQEKFHLLQRSASRMGQAMNHILLGGESVGALYMAEMEAHNEDDNPSPPRDEL